MQLRQNDNDFPEVYTDRIVEIAGKSTTSIEMLIFQILHPDYLFEGGPIILQNNTFR